MHILIDGYNLLHATGLIGRAADPHGLRRARQTLVRLVAQRLASTGNRATIVFDAAGAPPGLPVEETMDPVVVLYAKGYEDADTLIEELIRRESSPKKLTVVSSDRRIQRAARHRRAASFGSDAWFDELIESASEETDRPEAERRSGEKLPPELRDRLIAEALAQFGDLDPDAMLPPPPEERPEPPVQPTDGGEPLPEEKPLVDEAFPSDYLDQVSEEANRLLEDDDPATGDNGNMTK